MKNAVLWIIGGIALILVTRSANRGIRNNNWLNIKYNKANNWRGQIGVDEKGFVIFATAIDSLRAGFILLKNYASQGITTLNDIVHRFAPASENDTENYIRIVTKLTGLHRFQQVTALEWPHVLQAMVKVEVDTNVPIETVYKAQQLAFAA